MNSKEKSRVYFDAESVDYNNSGDGKFVQPMYAPLVSEIQKIGRGKLLDVGCGNGNLFGLLDADKFEFCGADFSEGMIYAAIEAYGKIAQFTVADVENLPYKNDTFDILVCNASFHHYTNPDEAVSEMARVLKREGTALIGDPYPPQPVRWLFNLFIRFSNAGDYHFYGKNEMTKLLAKHGLLVQTITRSGEHALLYVIKKA